MPDLDTWQSVAVALAIGLLIGAERERSKHEVGSAGVRTFALVALIGALSTQVPGVAGALLLGGVAVMVGLGYWRSYAADPGMTSEAALLLTLGLGALTPDEPALAAGLAVVTAVLLVSKDVLHRFVRDTITDLESTDALKFFVAAFIVLPLLPTDPVGPYDVLVPQRIWLLVVFITGIGWVGYAATRVLGSRRGLLVAGLAGGFVSGTATTAAMAARSRQGVGLRPALAGAVMASIATLLQLAVVTAFVEPEVTARLAPAIAAGCLVMLAEAWWLTRGSVQAGRAGTAGGPSGPEPAAPVGRPFALVPALVLAAVISAVLLLATWMTDRYGASAISVATATGALADLHAAAVAVATLVGNADVELSAGLVAISLGLLTNTIGKLLVAMAGGGPRFAGVLLALFLPVAVVIAVAIWAALP